MCKIHEISKCKRRTRDQIHLKIKRKERKDYTLTLAGYGNGIMQFGLFSFRFCLTLLDVVAGYVLNLFI